MVRYVGTALLLISTVLMPAADAQLRPRRVGTNAAGGQEAYAGAGAGGGADPSAGIAEAMNAMGLGDGEGADALAQMMKGLGGEGGGDMMAQMMKGLGNMQDNPMLKGLADANPELAEMMSNPEKMAEQMKKVGELMSSEEGQETMGKMMREMTSVLTDPEKLQQGLEQLTTNPALAGIADAVPGLREVLDNPEAMREQVEKTAELFQSMGARPRTARARTPHARCAHAACRIHAARTLLMVRWPMASITCEQVTRTSCKR